MTTFFSIDTIAFTIIGYPMSYIELVGTILYLWSVWLIARRRILTWPVGIVSVILYMMLFYQIRLYSDAAEQFYYLFACVYGWWKWTESPKEKGRITDVFFSKPFVILLAAGITILLSIADGFVMSRIHLLAPALFPEPASLPYLDAVTTIMSFTAMFLMAQKRIESWIYWIVVDVMGIGIYFVKDVKFISLLYVILLILAVKGFFGWVAASKPARSGGRDSKAFDRRQ